MLVHFLESPVYRIRTIKAMPVKPALQMGCSIFNQHSFNLWHVMLLYRSIYLMYQKPVPKLLPHAIIPQEPYLLMQDVHLCFKAAREFAAGSGAVHHTKAIGMQLSQPFSDCGQNFMTILCDEHGVLMLCSQAAIPCHDCPPIPPHLVPGVAINEDWLYGECLIGDHQGSVTTSDGGDNWLGMEMPAHSMSHEVRTDSYLQPVCKTVNCLQILSSV